MGETIAVGGRMGEMITFRANGRMGDGYLASPASGHGPGVVLVQEWWGLVDHIKRVADRFATEGFFALAPDLYHGEKTKYPEAASRLMMALNTSEVAKDIGGAATYLLALDGVAPKWLGAVGFSMGGQLALFGACEFPQRIGASVDFYGVHPLIKPTVSRLSGPVLAHFGLRDNTTPPDAANALVQRIREAGKQVEAHFYDAGHAFFNDDRSQAYDADAAQLAWQRTIKFLRSALPA